jgi:integrase
MSNTEPTRRRDYGSGRLFIRETKTGRGVYYGTWWSNGRRVNRRIGPVDELTRPQAEARLRELMTSTDATPPTRGGRVTVNRAAERYLAHLEALGRKPSYTRVVESCLRVWVRPRWGDRALDAVQPEDVEDLMRAMRHGKLGPKTIRNHIGTLGGLYRYAMHPRRRWASANPAGAVDLPPWELSPEIRFLTRTEVDALTAAAVPGDFEHTDRALFLTAAMTGLRLGELRALRWRDVDWSAGRIRVRRNYVRGEYGTPKSRRASRSVPMHPRVGGELDRLFKRSSFQGDDELVFAEPDSGEPLRDRALVRRYRRALKAARLDTTHRFHDLRHTFGTAMAAAGVPMRTLQEWMGHRHLSTTQRYADYAPSPHEAAMVERAFAADQLEPVDRPAEHAAE